MDVLPAISEKTKAQSCVLPVLKRSGSTQTTKLAMKLQSALMALTTIRVTTLAINALRTALNVV